MSTYVYTAGLDEHPLPEILHTISHYQVPGVLHCLTATEEKTIHFAEGVITGVGIVKPPGGLADFLLARGTITQAQRDKTRQWQQEGHGGEGSILVAIGALAPAALDQAQHELAITLLNEIFDWPAGQARVNLGAEGAAPAAVVKLPIRTVILDGIRQMRDPKRALQAVGHKDTLLEPAASALERMEGLKLNRDEMRLLRLVDGDKTFYQLVQAGQTAGLAQGVAVKAIYALYALKIIERKTGPLKMRA